MKRWKVVVGVALVFLLGVVIGSLGTHRFYVKRAQSMIGNPSAIRQTMVRGLTWRLHLTSAQQTETENAIRDAQREFREIRKEVQPRVEEILKRAEDRIRTQLDDGQRAKFDKLVAEHKGRWQNMQLD